LAAMVTWPSSSLAQPWTSSNNCAKIWLSAIGVSWAAQSSKVRIK
jgi:hypothetical protein